MGGVVNDRAIFTLRFVETQPCETSTRHFFERIQVSSEKTIQCFKSYKTSSHVVFFQKQSFFTLFSFKNNPLRCFLSKTILFYVVFFQKQSFFTPLLGKVKEE